MKSPLFSASVATTPVPSSTLPTSSSCADNSCSLRTQWGSEETLDHLTGDIFVVWWDRKYNHQEDARGLIDKLVTVRRDCLDNLGMADPPNPAQGYFFNVYLHHGKDDLFPEGWAMGVGMDKWGLRYLTVGHGSEESLTIYHEGFHIFQISRTSPGFAYSGDSMWYF